MKLLQELLTVLEFAPDDHFDQNGPKLGHGSGDGKPPEHVKHGGDGRDNRDKISDWMKYEVAVIAVPNGGGEYYSNDGEDYYDKYIDVDKLTFLPDLELLTVARRKTGTGHFRDDIVKIPSNAKYNTVDVHGHTARSPFIIDDCSGFGNPETLELKHTDIKSLRGLDKMTNLRSLVISPTDPSTPLDLTLILKLSHLEFLQCWEVPIDILHDHADDEELKKSFTSRSITTDDQKDFLKALSIVYTHIKKDKNVEHCKEDLINAGLKQFCG
jgi:hypothetical protein